MSGEVVGMAGRIKYSEHRTGRLDLTPPLPPPLQQLSAVMARLESCGMVPVLDDGLVGGNCAISAAASGLDSQLLGAGASSCSGSSHDEGAAAELSHVRCCAVAPGAVLISRSGKPPGAVLQAADWVLLTRFDATAWHAEFASAAEGARPSSDAPLHAAALQRGAAQRFGWGEQPLVAVHGHALAEGQGLESARRAGLPVSERETLFSTPDDLHALEALFRAYPYPYHRCFIRRGHGFLLLAQSVAEAESYLEQHVLPLAGLANRHSLNPSAAKC